MPPTDKAVTELLKGSVRVLCEIRNLEQRFGEYSFSADRSMLAHWARLLEEELAADLRARLPELQKLLAGLESAKKVSAETLNLRVDV